MSSPLWFKRNEFQLVFFCLACFLRTGFQSASCATWSQCSTIVPRKWKRVCLPQLLTHELPGSRDRVLFLLVAPAPSCMRSAEHRVGVWWTASCSPSRWFVLIFFFLESFPGVDEENWVLWTKRASWFVEVTQWQTPSSVPSCFCSTTKCHRLMS